MNIPGFTAEASLYNVSTRYRATAEAGFYGGIVQPAGPTIIHPYKVFFCSKYIPMFDPVHGVYWVEIFGIC